MEIWLRTMFPVAVYGTVENMLDPIGWPRFLGPVYTKEKSEGSALEIKVC